MIAFLRGEILDRDEAVLSLFASTDSLGVGYEVRIPDRAEYSLLQPGAQAALHVYTHVREEALDLFGFLTRSEKRLFLMLLSVTGIGPKGALAVLTGMNELGLIRAITEKDLSALTSISGVGKKTAERILLELAEPLAKRIERGELPQPPEASSPSDRRRTHESATPAPSQSPRFISQARVALENLGYKTAEAERLIAHALESSAEPLEKVEDVVRGALRSANA